MTVLINTHGAQVDVPPAVVDDYLKQGWRRPGQSLEAPPLEKPKTRPRRPRK
jgi:hypothetical protein